ncbi:hypothetical protein BKI52_05895 [marine bacterium AO1-C]|nr:hypothetical protein BKI52_05895 [marine bacterium AO1-C]
MNFLGRLLSNADLFASILAIYGLLILLFIVLGVYWSFVGYFGQQSASTLFKKAGIYLSIAVGLGLLHWINLDSFWQFFNDFVDHKPKNQGAFISFLYVVKLVPLAIFYLFCFIAIYVGPFFCGFYAMMTVFSAIVPKGLIPVIQKAAYYLLFTAFSLTMISPFIVALITYMIDLFA